MHNTGLIQSIFYIEWGCCTLYDFSISISLYTLLNTLFMTLPSSSTSFPFTSDALYVFSHVHFPPALLNLLFVLILKCSIDVKGESAWNLWVKTTGLIPSKTTDDTWCWKRESVKWSIKISCKVSLIVQDSRLNWGGRWEKSCGVINNQHHWMCVFFTMSLFNVPHPPFPGTCKLHDVTAGGLTDPIL